VPAVDLPDSPSDGLGRARPACAGWRPSTSTGAARVDRGRNGVGGLTAATGMVLLVLQGIDGVTVLSVRLC
jgi:hypothetical protein